VIASSEASQAFNDEVLNEHVVFQLAKRIEMKELLGGYADGQIAMYQKSISGTFVILSLSFFESKN
jgi:hypothetical protein